MAALTDRDVNRLLADRSIIRHRGKIEASIHNARAATTALNLPCTGSAATRAFTRTVGDWVGEWNRGAVDAFEPARMTGSSGQPQLYVHNTDWFGAINGRRGITLDRIF